MNWNRNEWQGRNERQQDNNEDAAADAALGCLFIFGWSCLIGLMIYIFSIVPQGIITK